MNMKIEPVTLTGNVVRLEPLQLYHAPALLEAGQDPTIWQYMFFKPQPASSLIAIEDWIASALRAQETGQEQPFAIIDLQKQCAVGSTRYLTIIPRNRGLEIGATWLNPAVQRTAINTECKYLLLRHAFEVCGAIRVQLKTHHENLKSQRAIERLGAVKEGVLRNHIIMPDGSYRHSVYYSILDDEWPTIKTRLEARMSQG